MDSFSRDDLERALYDERILIRIPCMRSHLYVVPSEDLPAYYQASKRILGDDVTGYLDYLVAHSHTDSPKKIVPSELMPRVLEVINTRGPCTIEELAEFLPVLGTRLTPDNDESEVGEFTLASRLVPAMCSQGLLVHARPKGSWRSDMDSYAALSSWLPGVSLDSLDGRVALQRVVRAYLAAFGPAAVGDMVHWFGSPRRREVIAALMDLGPQVSRVEVVGFPGEYLVPSDDVPHLFSSAPSERFARLLPPCDSTLMAYRDTSRFLHPSYRERVYDWVGESQGAVMVDGLVRGLWSLNTKPDRISIRLFEALDPEAIAMIGEEAIRLAPLVADDRLDVEISVGDLNGDVERPTSVPLGLFLPEPVSSAYEANSREEPEEQ